MIAARCKMLGLVVASGVVTASCAFATYFRYWPLAVLLIVLNVMLTAFAVLQIYRRTGTLHRLFHAISNLDIDRSSLELFEQPGRRAQDAAIDSLAEGMKRQFDEFRQAAHRDGLTGLSNRIIFQQHVQQLIAQGGDDFRCALIFIDMDGFKATNDTLGHNIGDRLLQIAADRLRIASRLDKSDDDGTLPAEIAPLIARFGGDEFLLCLPHPDCEKISPRIAARVLRVLAEPFEIGPHTVCVSASIGVSLFPQNGTEFAELLRAADTAMYSAKRAGRNRAEFYDPMMDEEARQQAEEEQELRDAITLGGLELHFQPLYDLRTMQVTSAEALIRWRHPRKGLLIPRQFLHLAERADLVPQIGEWVIEEAVKRIAEFERTGIPIQISVNISPRHLERADFVPAIKSALARWKVSPHRLQIEVTEEVAIRDPELARRKLLQVSEMGVTIAIDDFGTGYSNLASLIMLPISRLKIDRSLLKDLTVRPDARVLVQTIVSMANSLGFHSIAEGVETESQLELLSAMGCDIVQGFLMSKPVEHAQLREIAARQHARAIDCNSLTDAA